MKRFVRSQRRALDRLLRKRVAGTGLEPHEYLARMEVRTGPPVPPLREPEPSFRRYLWLDERARAASEADARDLRALVGTPPEVLAAIERVENETGRAIRDAWPSFRAVVHGGVKFTPFAQALRLRCGPGIRFVEVIRPAEGVTLAAKGRLRPDKRVYFEFVPLAGGDARGADELHSRVPYRVLVTDGEEHWRYDGGCVVRFEGPRRVVGLQNSLDAGAFGERLSRDDVEGVRGPAAGLKLVPEYPTATEPLGRYRIEAEYGHVPDDLAEEGRRIDEGLMAACDGYRRLREGGVLRAPWLRLRPAPAPAPR